MAFLMSQIAYHLQRPTGFESRFGLPVLGAVSEVTGEQQRAQVRVWSRGFGVLAGQGLVGVYVAADL